jgi:hypothetical protein
MKQRRITNTDFFKIKVVLSWFGYNPNEQTILKIKIGMFCITTALTLLYLSAGGSTTTDYGNYEEIKAAHPELEL